MTLLEVKTDKNQRGIIKIDPRTYLYLILISNLAVFFMSSIVGEVILMVSILFLSILCGVKREAIKFIIFYLILLSVDCIATLFSQNGFLLTLALGCRYLRRIFPCGMLGITLIKTTSVGEFMAALTKMKVPKSILIPLTILIRYFPSIGEDRSAIKKAMAMRGLSSNFFENPKLAIECIYVPLLMSASRRADELSSAAITRGIENPKPRTTLTDVEFHFTDFICFLLGTAIVLFCVMGV